MNPNHIIYIDVLLVINLIMDYLVLWATARLGQFNTTFLRLFFGAMLGSFYSIAVILPQTSVTATVAVKIIFSILMLLIVFGFKNWRVFVRIFCYLYVVAFSMGGAVIGAIYLLNENPAAITTFNGVLLTLSNVHYAWLIAALVTAVIVSRLAVFIKKNLFHSFYSLPVIIRVGKENLAVKALVDTGNQLKDPITKKPVLIVEYDVLKEILPREVKKGFETPGEPDVNQIIADLADEKWLGRFRLIPFTTIGRSHGMLLGLRPDDIMIVAQDKTIKVQDVMIAIYQKKLSGEGSYRALLHPEIVQGIITT